MTPYEDPSGAGGNARSLVAAMGAAAVERSESS